MRCPRPGTAQRIEAGTRKNPASPFNAKGIVLPAPLTPGDVFPIDTFGPIYGVQLTAHNNAGTFCGGTAMMAGFQHGPGSLTSSTAAASGSVRLVTPVFLSTNIALLSVVPAFGILDLHFVPEPATLLLLGGGMAWMVLLGRAKRG